MAPPPSAGMPPNHRQTKPESNPFPRSKPLCPHRRLPESAPEPPYHPRLLQVALGYLSTEAPWGPRAGAHSSTGFRERANGWGPRADQ